MKNLYFFIKLQGFKLFRKRSTIKMYTFINHHPLFQIFFLLNNKSTFNCIYLIFINILFFIKLNSVRNARNLLYEIPFSFFPKISHIWTKSFNSIWIIIINKFIRIIFNFMNKIPTNGRLLHIFIISNLKQGTFSFYICIFFDIFYHKFWKSCNDSILYTLIKIFLFLFLTYLL